MSTSAAPVGDGIVVRDLLPRDVQSYCALLSGVFEQDYGDQGLDLKGFERLYRLVAWANLLLRALRLDFFQVSVAVEEGRVVGTVSSFRAGRRAWYQGFGALHPSTRGRGLYKRIARHALANAAARGGRWGGGEIKPSNERALASYRDKFGAEVLPARQVYVGRPEVIPDPEQPVALASISTRRFRALPEAATIAAAFRGGFLIEEGPKRSLVRAILGWQLPPLTAEPYACFRDGQLSAFVRVRTHWPARIRALDAIYFAPGLGRDTIRQILLSVLALYKRRTRLPIRVYVDAGQDELEAVCLELGLTLLAPLCPIRTDIPAALARTDEEGRLHSSAVEGERA